MGESLGGVAEEGAARGVDLFGEEADVVGHATASSMSSQASFDLTGAGEGVDEPEAAGDEGALLFVHPA